MTDRIEHAKIDQEVAEELQRHRVRVRLEHGRDLSVDEVKEIHRSPKRHGWIRHCKANHEHNAARLRSEGWSQVEIERGVWEWRKLQ